MTRRCCPACLTRRAQLIDPDCTVCAGHGFVVLGRQALRLHEPAVVSLAVGIALEAYARTIDEATTVGDDRIAPLRAVMKQLNDVGMIEREAQIISIKPLARADTPTQLADQAIHVSVQPIDAVLAVAPRYAYKMGDRPNARGLPVLSANGHPSHLARISDPAEPGGDTSADVVAGQVEASRARILAAAAPEAHKIKNRPRRTRAK